jgi:hypothetical protein
MRTPEGPVEITRVDVAIFVPESYPQSHTVFEEMKALSPCRWGMREIPECHLLPFSQRTGKSGLRPIAWTCHPAPDRQNENAFTIFFTIVPKETT